MPTFAAVDYDISVNAIDLSRHLRSVTVNEEADILDDTGFGQLWRSRLVGLRQFEVELEFIQNFDAATVHATLEPLFALNAPVPFTIKHVSAAVSATNPLFTGQVLVGAYTPFDSEVGALATFTVTWMGVGTPTWTII
ncbi:MAG: radical SAM protein [Nitriliruptorales bacterium]|nr:radical SAM protein [Nitriliruptorales bacterium]